MARQQTDLPFGDAFSPNSLCFTDDGPCELPYVLELIHQHQGQRDRFTEIIADEFFPDSSDPMVTAKNVPLGLGPAGYRLVDDDFELTDIGCELHELRDDEEALYDRFARYILLDLHGLKVMDIINDLQMGGESTTTTNITRELKRQYDLYVKESSTHWNQMRGWLAQADLINTNTHHIHVNWEKLDEIVGIETESRLELSGLSDAQQAFMRALAAIDPKEPIRNNKVRELAEDTYNVYIDSKSITSKVLDPLKEAGFIEYEATVKHTGKPSNVQFTEKFEAEILEPVIENISERSGVPRQVLRQSIAEIYEQMDADLNYLKGQALETLAVKIGLMLNLTFAGWQVRGTETGGAEVDVIMDEIGTGFSRWQIQCKNTQSKLRTKHVAREVGLARMLQSNVILMVSRSKIVPDARQYAKRIMGTENLTILFLADEDLEQLDDNPQHLTTALKRQTQQVHRWKQLGEGDRIDISDADEG
jgi:DNA-binding MarR family transcriptional regulator